MTDLKYAYRELPQLSFVEKTNFRDLGFMRQAFQRQMASRQGTPFNVQPLAATTAYDG